MQELSKDEFIITTQAIGVTLIYIWGSFCGPCRIFSPIIETLAEEYKYKAMVYKYSCDVDTQILDKYEILGVPTLLFFKDGILKEKTTGVQSESNIKEILDELI